MVYIPPGLSAEEKELLFNRIEEDLRAREEGVRRYEATVAERERVVREREQLQRSIGQQVGGFGWLIAAHCQLIQPILEQHSDLHSGSHCRRPRPAACDRRPRCLLSCPCPSSSAPGARSPAPSHLSSPEASPEATAGCPYSPCPRSHPGTTPALHLRLQRLLPREQWALRRDGQAASGVPGRWSRLPHHLPPSDVRRVECDGGQVGVGAEG